MNPQSIFKFVQDHINEEGRFTADFLPDDPSPTVPRPLGAEDAYYYTTVCSAPSVSGGTSVV